MHKHLITVFVFMLVAVLGAADGAYAQSRDKAAAAKKRRVRDTGQNAVVTVDGAAIYEAPNFDSPVMDYLDRGRKVRVSKKLYKGVGGLGAFYKIRVRKGVYGYITDVDIQLVGKDGSLIEPQRAAKEDGVMDPTELDPTMSGVDEAGFNTTFFKRYLGVTYSMFNYTEKIAARKKSAQTGFMGLKMSGPGSSMGGMPLDFEFTFTTTAPGFYDDYMSSAKGFLLLGHAMTLFPLVERGRWHLYYGFGLMAKYLRFDVNLKSQPGKPSIDAQDLVVGGAAHIGLAVGLGSRWCLRLDGKYYYEKEAYFGYGGAVQMQF